MLTQCREAPRIQLLQADIAKLRQQKKKTPTVISQLESLCEQLKDLGVTGGNTPHISYVELEGMLTDLKLEVERHVEVLLEENNF